MKTPFKTPRSFINAFATLALIGPIGSALGSDSSEEFYSMDEHSTSAFSSDDDTLLEDTFSTLPYELIERIAGHLSVQSFSQLRQTSPDFHDILSDEAFQLIYRMLFEKEYYDIINVQMPGFLGNDYSAHFKEMISGTPLYTFGRHLTFLMAPDNIDLLLAKDQELLKAILAPNLDMDFTKRFMISSFASKIFTEQMNGYWQVYLIKKLAHLNIEDLTKIAKYFPIFVTEQMEGYQQANLFSSLTYLSVEQISAIAYYFPNIATEQMDGDQKQNLFFRLAGLSVEEIHAAISDLSNK